MRPLTVKCIRNIIAGRLVQGSDEVIVQYGAYRLKQIKHPNTILFSNKKIINWKGLKDFFPLILVTDQEVALPGDPEDLTIIHVLNLEQAYWEFVHYYRDLFRIPIIAITGTSGKTTTKEMIKHILAAQKKVAATTNTSNSRTAHLQYLLSVDDQIEVAVFETAVGAPGDIQTAGKYFKPTIGIITNVGAHHLNYCKSIEGYIEAKGEMVKILDQTDGVLIINAEDQNTMKIDRSDYQGKLIKIGQHPSCHFRATTIQYDRSGMTFTLHHQEQTYHVFVTGYGEHQVYNALATIAAVYEVGVSIQEAIDLLKTYRKLNKQLQVFTGINGSLLLDDTWSINTTSLEAALKVLNDLGKDKRKIAIIGTITDLGSWGYIIHEQAGELITRHGVDVLITIGEHARIIANYAVHLGIEAQVYSFHNGIRAYDLLTQFTDENTVILIKGDMYSKTMIDLAAKLRTKN
ncbi:UDP-N-acetylmuramoyl-tripeptide--D-alanyl-D-alanine ligase [Sporosarcina sp. HYO08]|nr:UDP-N-acetylmuramoyl-tripeptide--D-alanyl-D-alanine ligase [Sporosarcina sp. HYO08]